MRRWRFLHRNRAAITVVFFFWIGLLLRQHAILVKESEKKGLEKPAPPYDIPFARPSSFNGPGVKADATFNGVPAIYRKGAPPVSEMKCTESEDWMFRSCLFQTMCFDLQQNDFVVVGDAGNSSVQRLHVSLGGINPRWDVTSPNEDPSSKGSWRLKWFPRTVTNVQGYYSLPENTVWVPFHSMAAHNVGHMLWDDMYAMFRLLRLWNLWDHNQHQHLLIRQQLNQTLYATCDKQRNRKKCRRNLEAFLQPVMGVDPATFSASRWVRWNITTTHDDDKSASLVCAPKAVVGIGVLTDHGLADHGWDYAKTHIPHNLGHGRDFWEFGQWARRQYADLIARKRPRIVFSLESSQDWDRRLDFAAHRAALAKAGILGVEVHRLWNMSVEEQLRLSATSDIFVTACGGGGALPVTFLPRGSSLILFYNPEGGYDYATGRRRPDWPARLDWDLVHFAAAHVRVHWMPIRFLNDENKKDLTIDARQQFERDLELFVLLIKHELNVLDKL